MLPNILDFWNKLTRTNKVLLSISLSIAVFLSICAIFADFIAPYNPYKVEMMNKLIPPCSEHWMGTDGLGRDILSRILYGTRSSLTVACIAVSIAGLVGLVIGPLSGYFGGIVDRILVIVTDSLYAFPPLILALIISLFLGSGLVNSGIAISWAFIPFFFKVMRSIAIMYKSKPFIESAIVDGGSNFYVLRRHIIPRCLGSMLILTSMGVVRSIITIAALGFLGYGVQPPTAEWGLDISTARMTLLSGVWWPVLFPGLFIFISVLGFDLITEVVSTAIGKKY